MGCALSHIVGKKKHYSGITRNKNHFSNNKVWTAVTGNICSRHGRHIAIHTVPRTPLLAPLYSDGLIELEPSKHRSFIALVCPLSTSRNHNEKSRRHHRIYEYHMHYYNNQTPSPHPLINRSVLALRDKWIFSYGRRYTWLNMTPKTKQNVIVQYL